MNTKFLAKLLKRWYLFIIPVLLLPSAAAFYESGKTTFYKTSGRIFVAKPSYASGTSGTSWNQFASSGQNGANLLNEMISFRQFSVKVAGDTDLARTYDLSSRGGQDAAYARIGGDVSAVPSIGAADSMTLIVTDHDPQMALQIANAVLKEFSPYIGQQELADDQKVEAFDQQELDTYKSALTQDDAQITQYVNQHPDLKIGGPTDPTLDQLVQQQTLDKAQVTKYSEELNSLRYDESAITTGTANLFTVIDPPQLPLAPSHTYKKLIEYTAGAFALALALIALIVGAQTLLDRKVYESRDVLNIIEDLELDIPVIESVPVLPEGKSASKNGRDQGGLSSAIMPVLMVLPPISDEQTIQDFRQATGVLVEDRDA